MQEPMVDAARDGDLAQVDRLLKLGADVDGEADDGRGTALIGAAAEGHTAVALLLIRRGADVNKAASYFGHRDEAPLEAAAGHSEIVSILKNAGATE